MYTNFQVHADSESSSDAQNIQIVPKCRKLLSGAAYRKAWLVDENRQLLHPANCNMPYSSHNPGTIMLIIIVWYNVIISALSINHALSMFLIIDIIDLY